MGRLITYGTLGALAGVLGEALPVGATWTSVVSAALVAVFAASMGGWMRPPEVMPPGLVKVAAWLMKASGPLASLGLGMATALLPCGLVYATLGLAVAAADPWMGAATMVVFGMGTIPALAAAGGLLRAIAQRGPRVRQVLAIAVLAACWTAIGVRHAAAAHAVETGEAPSCH